jgi:tetratricopeptide (TPR) repeat protein
VPESAIVRDGTTLALDRARAQVDVAELEAGASEDTPRALEAVVDLYEGPLLHGFTLDEPAFDDWLRVERARVHDVALRAFERLAELLEAAGERERALGALQRLLRVDPAREDVHRRVMRLHAAAGRRAEGLRQYAACIEALKRELDVEPDEETRRLAAALRQEDAPAAPRPAPHRSPMIGRDADLDRVLAEAGSGAGKVVLVTGEAGVGKTRLLEAVMDATVSRGARVLLGHAIESEQVLPFALWSDLLRAHPDLASDAPWTALSPYDRREIERILPGRRDAGRPAPPDAHEAFALFDAMHRLLTAEASRAPLVVVLEDLHWADAQSLRLVSFLARRAQAGSRMALVASLRSEEVDRTSFVEAILAELDRADRRADVPLRPLDRTATEALARSLAPARLEGMSGPLWSLSEGNPLALVEAVRGLEGGAPAPDLARVPVPLRIRSLVEGRAARLPPLARDILATAAVVGADFDFDLLRAARIAEDEALAGALDLLVDRRFLRVTAGRFDFTHDRVREAIREMLLPHRLEHLHRRVAAALERAFAGDLGSVAGRLGHHHARAGNTAASITHRLALADRCIARYGLDEALAALEEAGAQVARLPPQEQGAPSIEIAIRRAQCLFSLGRFEEIVPAMEPLDAAADRVDVPALRMAFHAWQAAALCYAGEEGARERSMAHGERALEEAQRCDAVTAGAAHMILAHGAFHAGAFRRSVSHAREALARLDGTPGGERWAIEARLHLARSAMTLGDWRQALDVYARTIEDAGRAGAIAQRSLATAATAFIHCALGDGEKAMAMTAEATKLAPDPFSRVLAAWVAARIGAWLERAHESPCAEAIDVLERAIAGTEGVPPRGWTALVRVGLAEAYLARGEADRARTTALLALEEHRRAGDRLAAGWALAALALSERALARTARARALLEEAIALFASLEAPMEVAWTTLRLGLVLLECGDAGDAHRRFDEAARRFRALDLEAPARLAADLARPRASAE